MTTNIAPIYVETHYIQRLNITGRPPESGYNTGDVNRQEKGYKLLAGRVVDVWFYNQADGRYKPVDGGPFFEPVEFMDLRAYDLFMAAGIQTTVTNLADADKTLGGFRLKFTDESYIPFVRYDDDQGICSGFFDGEPDNVALASG